MKFGSSTPRFEDRFIAPYPTRLIGDRAYDSDRLDAAQSDRVADGIGMTDVGALPQSNMSFGYGINNNGQIVGPSLIDLEPHAFLVSDALVLTDLGSLGGGDSIAYDINDVGQVTGQSWTNDDSSHAFVWAAGSMRDIGTLGSQNSVGRSINFSGNIAGESETGAGQTTRAFRFTEADGMVNLGALGRPYRKNPKARSATARTATAGSGREFEAGSEKLINGNVLLR
jgi:probable HAF family extracellular repeat protein